MSRLKELATVYANLHTYSVFENNAVPNSFNIFIWFYMVFYFNIFIYMVIPLFSLSSVLWKRSHICLNGLSLTRKAGLIFKCWFNFFRRQFCRKICSIGIYRTDIDSLFYICSTLTLCSTIFFYKESKNRFNIVL